MSFLQEIKDARNGHTVPLTYFLSDSDLSNKNVCYGFVEGNDDPSYYRTKIKQQLPDNGQIKLYPCGGKLTVKYTYEAISRRNLLTNNRIAFFIDRDLSSIIDDDNLILSPYVYVTDEYSIENSMVSLQTLLDVAQDVLGFSILSSENKLFIQHYYDSQFTVFINIMLPIMANIVLWKRHDVKGNYNNFHVNKIIRIKNATINYIDDNPIKIFYCQSNVDYDKNYNYEQEQAECNKLRGVDVQKIIRGKYIAQFFIMLCNSLYEDAQQIGLTTTCRGRKLCDSDMMLIIAPRTETPKSLKVFIESTFCQYYKSLS